VRELNGNYQLHLGELLQIELMDSRNCKAIVQFVRDREIWAQKFIERGLGLEGTCVNVQIIRDKQIWVPKYLGENEDYDTDKFEYYNDLCLYFKAIIRKNEILQGMEMTKMERVSEISRMQRRKTFRLKMHFDVYLRSKEKLKDYTRCQGTDISEAGIGALTVCNEFKMGDAVDCIFILEGLEYYFPATVVRRVDRSDGCYHLGIKFNIEKEKQVRFIRRYIYKKQIKKNDC
jgi:hypothetical protein